ncbi:aminotransferase class I/II-fold pyridoxal phosphate-dependent enzyme [Faecalicatena contorta]|uniref:MalY/PatB family protein n=1 Tax=Faecalicatena contorta TaxID=39482 RepID=UPI002E9ACC9F|nr:aminotransferase class I/II-fold pyridoxal phosphate-dependent enzyme [Muricomes sp.]
MKYDFTTIMERAGHDALAVDTIPMEGVEVKKGFTRIPMWVADMNFPTLPTILEAMEDRLKHHHFGYFDMPDVYYDSIINWQKDRFGVTGMTREDIGYENGVLGCVSSALQAFTAPGEAVLMHAPAYIGFTKTVESIGRKLVLSELVRSNGGAWRMDLEDMERKLRDNHIHCVIFCSPHNPTGRVWDKEELEQAMVLFQKYDCVVISDEIWADLTLPGHTHIPLQSVSEDARERTIAIYAPSKTFNLAGLIGSYHVIYAPYLRDRIAKYASASHYNSCNVLSMHALIGAYKEEGREWVDELRTVLGENADYAYKFITKHFEGVTLAKPEGTYMLFLDCEAWCKKHEQSLDDLLRAGVEVGVIWQDGRPFYGKYSIRVNLALPKVLVEEAMERLAKYVFI